jgi:hypothetical protein
VDGIAACSDCGATLVAAEPAWSDDPAALRQIGRDYRALPIQDRFRRRQRVGLGPAWELSGPLHPGERSWTTSAGLYVHVVRCAWYLAVGVPEDRVRKRDRLATGPWRHPPADRPRRGRWT